MKGGQMLNSATNFVTAWWCYIALAGAVIFAYLYYSTPQQKITVKQEKMCGSCPGSAQKGLLF